MKVFLLTFGGGKRKYRQAAQRVRREAFVFHFFDAIYPVTDKQLKSDHQKFWKDHGAFINQHPRGFGLWLWKPYLVQHLLDRMPANSILAYVDCGCTLNPNGADRLKQYCEMALERQCLAFQMLNQPESMWNKQDTIDHLQALPEDVASGQLVGGVFFIKNTTRMQELVAEWLRTSTTDNYHHLDDSASSTPNAQGFVEHRHDQAIWSLLLKKWNRQLGLAILPDETFFHPDWFTNGIDYPVWTTRNKSGYSFGKRSLWKTFLHFAKKKKEHQTTD